MVRVQHTPSEGKPDHRRPSSEGIFVALDQQAMNQRRFFLLRFGLLLGLTPFLINSLGRSGLGL